MSSEPTDAGVAQSDVLREQAIKRLRKRRDFHAHLLVYVLVNGFLTVIWAAINRHGFFWPIFPMLGWGVGLVMNAWDVYRGEELSEDSIQREMQKLRPGG
jgi:hypothetical protein